MLDLRWVVENPDAVKETLRKRRHDADVIDIVIKHDEKRRSLIQEQEAIRSERNRLAKEIAQLKRNGEDAEEQMQASKANNAKLSSIEEELEKEKAILEDHLLRIPNIIDPSVPEGDSEEDNVEIDKWGEPRKFSFEPKDHATLGENLGILDFERSGRLAGSRFCTLIGKGARLSRGLKELMLRVHTEEHGFTEILPPFIVNSKSLIGTSQLPKFYEDLFKLEGTDYFLNPTSEVPVTNFHREEILNEADLPLKYTCYSPCFRSEAGSYGKDTRGMIRQHQFEKVELVIFSPPAISADMHELIRSSAEKILQMLELPYRTMRICSGDIGFGGAKQYDLEVWLPSQGRYREISSCSNFHDYQARRANIRFRPTGGGKPEHVHTLNGSGLAIGRTLLAVLENYQQEDGSILIPDALRQIVGFDRIYRQN